MSQSIYTLTFCMDTSRLLLNPYKTQAIWLGGHSQLAKFDFPRLSSLFPHITLSTSVRNLGVMPDPELTFSHHRNLVERKLRFPFSYPTTDVRRMGASLAATAKLCLASFRVFLDLLLLHGSLEAIIFIVLFRFVSCVVPVWFSSPEYGYLSSLKHHSIELVNRGFPSTCCTRSLYNTGVMDSLASSC